MTENYRASLEECKVLLKYAIASKDPDLIDYWREQIRIKEGKQ